MKFLSDILAKARLVVDGVVQLNNTATGQTPASGDNSTKLATTAFIKNQNYLTGNQTITLSGDATGSGTTSIAVTLANTGVTSGTYGNASSIPTITVDSKGRITSISTTAVSIVTTLAGLSDVQLSVTLVDKQVLQYNAATGKWVNASANIDPATTSTLGTIIVGAGLSVTAQGVLSVNGTGSARLVETFTATAGQTIFTVAQSYTVGLVDVYVNGTRLSSSTFTATNGTTIVLTDAAVAGDIIDIVKYTPLSGLAFSTDNVPEGTTNLYFTNARARAAISLTTTGTSGAATYNSSTGVLNVPAYTLAGLGGIGGSGTTGYVSKFTNSTTIGNSLIYDNGTGIGINTASPYNSSIYSLDVNGALLVKNVGKAANITLINSDPAGGGNNAFVIHTVGGTFANSYVDIQGYYGTSITGSTTIRLNPAGGNVLIGGLIGSGNRMVIATSTGLLSTQAIPTLSDLSGVPTSRTLTINGTSFDLSADRTWSVGTLTGSGSTNYIPKRSGSTSLTDSLLFDDGSGVGLGTASISASALFQMNSTTKGFLPPRMTAAQRGAISSPAVGLVVYQTDGTEGLWAYTSNGWRALAIVN